MSFETSILENYYLINASNDLWSKVTSRSKTIMCGHKDNITKLLRIQETKLKNTESFRKLIIYLSGVNSS